MDIAGGLKHGFELTPIQLKVIDCDLHMGHDGRTSFINDSGRQARASTHLQARAMAKGGQSSRTPSGISDLKRPRLLGASEIRLVRQPE